MAEANSERTDEAVCGACVEAPAARSPRQALSTVTKTVVLLILNLFINGVLDRGWLKPRLLRPQLLESFVRMSVASLRGMVNLTSTALPLAETFVFL